MFITCNLSGSSPIYTVEVSLGFHLIYSDEHISSSPWTDFSLFLSKYVLIQIKSDTKGNCQGSKTEIKGQKGLLFILQ
jgi:hypothetical protein